MWVKTCTHVHPLTKPLIHLLYPSLETFPCLSQCHTTVFSIAIVEEHKMLLMFVDPWQNNWSKTRVTLYFISLFQLAKSSNPLSFPEPLPTAWQQIIGFRYRLTWESSFQCSPLSLVEQLVNTGRIRPGFLLPMHLTLVGPHLHNLTSGKISPKRNDMTIQCHAAKHQKYKLLLFHAISHRSCFKLNRNPDITSRSDDDSTWASVSIFFYFQWCLASSECSNLRKQHTYIFSFVRFHCL